jgi:hypothetical protein
MFRQPTRVPVTMLAFRGRPPLWPAGQEYRIWMAAQTRLRFRTQLLSVAEIEPDRPASQNPSIDMGAYAPKIAC